MRLTVTFSEPPTGTEFSAVLAGVCDAYPDARLVEPTDNLTVIVETGPWVKP